MKCTQLKNMNENMNEYNYQRDNNISPKAKDILGIEHIHFKENTPVDRICIKDYGYGRKKSKNKNKLSYKCKLYACKALKFVGELIICVICFPCACIIVKSQCR